MKNGIAQAAVLNSSGKFVKASKQSMAAACNADRSAALEQLLSSLSNAPGADSFPISSFSWIYLRTQSADSVRAAELGDFLDWVYTEGQQFAGTGRVFRTALPAALGSEKQSQRFAIGPRRLTIARDLGLRLRCACRFGGLMRTRLVFACLAGLSCVALAQQPPLPA